MVDPISLAVAIAGLAAGGIAGYGVWIQRGQLRAAEAQLAAATEQLKTEAAKVDALGNLVSALRDMLAAQSRQLEAFRQSLRLQAESNEIARMDAAVRAAQLEFERTNPIDKATEAVKEVWERGVTNPRTRWDRNIRRRRTLLREPGVRVTLTSTPILLANVVTVTEVDQASRSSSNTSHRIDQSQLSGMGGFDPSVDFASKRFV
ncbi:MAG TPA: hypothetical protein VFG07_09040 [Thermoplasmata archaeon]|nr:hypothetical protein [Thermoplasmata archaeon]